MTTHTPEAPDVAEFSQEAILQHQKRFQQQLEALGISEGSTDEVKGEALRLRVEAERITNAISLFINNPDSDASDRIKIYWEQLTGLYEQLMELRSKVIGGRQAAEIGVATPEEVGEKLEDQIEDNYDMDSAKSLKEKLLTIAAGIADDPSAPVSKRYFRLAKGLNVNAIVKDKRELQNMLKTATPNQERVLNTMIAMLDNIGQTQVVAYRSQQWYAEQKERKRAGNVPLKFGRLALLVGSTLMALWATSAKNKKMAASYGLIALLTWKSSLFKGQAYHIRRQLKHITNPEVVKYLKKPGSHEAIEEFYAFHNSGSGKFKNKSGKLSKMQARELFYDGYPKLYKVLASMKKDQERMRFLSQLNAISNKDAQELAVNYVHEQEQGVLSTPQMLFLNSFI